MRIHLLKSVSINRLNLIQPVFLFQGIKMQASNFVYFSRRKLAEIILFRQIPAESSEKH